MPKRALQKTSSAERARTLGTWRREAGELVKVRLTPDELAARAALQQDDATCSYRLNSRGRFGAWQEVEVVREEMGVFAYLRGLQRESYFEVKIDLDGETWLSPATPQYCRANLDRAGRP